MIRFVDIETGNIFNGESPYVFWLGGEQSINLWYSKPICFISHDDQVTVNIENNEVFNLLNEPNTNQISYIDIHNLINNDHNLILNGVYHNGFYVYMFYVMVHSKNIGECLVNFSIRDSEGEHTYKLGADFYGENEFHHINLSNLGIEIPDTIQKALYTANVEEDKKDNILLNRKWKELLSNYWDVIANKGSYKSLFNSLKWFEYGDRVKLMEIWKHSDFDRTIYDERSIKEVLGNKYFETLNGFSKTTYIAISSALEQMVKKDGIIQYDEEKNPKIEYVVQDWSIKDLSLKLSMLGSFYKTYFMPIHLDCIRSTIEDIIYTNTIKLSNGCVYHREDSIYNVKDIICNVKDGDVFKLGPVRARVGKETIFGNYYNKFKSQKAVDIIGVQQEEPKFDETEWEDQIKTYNEQYFDAIGSIIDFHIQLPQNTEIKRSLLAYKGDVTNEWNTLIDNRIFTDNIKFQLLCTKEQEYDIRLEFHSTNDEVFIKRIKFLVVDSNEFGIKVYKIQNIGIPDLNNEANEYRLGMMLNNERNPVIFKQYIPAKNVNPNLTSHWGYSGICLNHMIILKYSKSLAEDHYISSNYFTFVREINNALVYTICISKQFGFKPNYLQLKRYPVYREEYIFYPDFHKLVEFGGGDLESYTITDEDALCVVPNLSCSKYIEEAQWEFINVSKPNKPSIIPPIDIKEPFIAPTEKSFLEPGYYNIVFRYRLSGEKQINTITLDSAFLKK